MHNWLSFVNGGFAGPVCLAITVVGLVLSVIAWRRRGVRSGLRGAAWSLLPLAAWLTHSLAMLGRVVSAVVVFASGFVLSPKAWLGIALVGVSALLFLISGGIPLVGWRRHRKAERVEQRRGPGGPGGPGGPSGPGREVEEQRRAAVPSARTRPQAGDQGLSPDVEDILRRHGIK